MLVILIPLLTLSLLSLFSGVIWLLASGAEHDEREVQNAGEEITADMLQDEDGEPIFEKTAHKSSAKGVESKVSYSFRDIKGEMKAGQWHTATPLLMAVGGFLGLLLFGSLVLLVAIDNKLLGSVITIVALATVARVIVAMIRA